MPLSQKHLAHQGLALCLAAAIPGVSLAIEYSALPSVTLQETYNDNIRMSRTLSESVSGTILIPRLNLTARTHTWQVGTDMHLRAARYQGIKGLDANDRTVNLFSQIQSERNTLQIGGGRARDSILTGEIFDADTGLVKTQTFRVTDSTNVSWTWSMTARNQLKLSYQYADVTYQDNVESLYDYTQRGPNATLTRLLNERTQVFLQASSNLFNIPPLPQSRRGQSLGTRVLSVESTTNGLQAGIDYQFSETLRGSLAAGQRKTNSDNVVESCSFIFIFLRCSEASLTIENRSSVYTAALAKNFAASKLTTRVERAIDPSGAGVLIQRDTLALNIEWSKTERLSYLFSGRGDKIRAIEGATIFVDRNQYFIEPSIQWRVSRDSRINLSYRYSYLRYLNDPETAHSNGVNLAFTQAWRKMSISR